jgi:hypothetical protein
MMRFDIRTTQKSYWLGHYERNKSDYPEMTKKPIFVDLWRRGAPKSVIRDVELALKVRFGDGDLKIANGFLARAAALAEEVVRENVLNDELHQITALSTKAEFLYGRALLRLMENKQVAPQDWNMIVEGFMDRVATLKRAGDDAPDDWLDSVKCLILSGQFERANTLIKVRRQCKNWADEFETLKVLCKAIVDNGLPIMDEAAIKTVVAYFEKYRDPAYVPRHKNGSLGPILNINRMFVWGLILTQCIEPGDGILDAYRAIEIVSA